jgi:uncharacterized membrane protein
MVLDQDGYFSIPKRGRPRPVRVLYVRDDPKKYEVAMRTTLDRIRHTLSFEIIGLAIVAPLGTWIFDMPIHDIGMVALFSAILAAVWNYVFNVLFDRSMVALCGSVHKTVPLRVAHSVVFEAGLLVVLMPLIAWYLHVSLLQAFMMDVSFSAFYLVYAFVFNWAYDVLFPIPQVSRKGAKQVNRADSISW